MKLSKLQILFLAGAAALIAGILLLKHWGKLYQEQKEAEAYPEDEPEDGPEDEPEDEPIELIKDDKEAEPATEG